MIQQDSMAIVIGYSDSLIGYITSCHTLYAAKRQAAFTPPCIDELSGVALPTIKGPLLCG